MNTKLSKIVILAVAISSLSTVALAATQQGSLTVSVKVTASCSFSSPIPKLDFGNGISGNASTIIPITCTKGTSYSITADGGLHYSASPLYPNKRAMMLEGATTGDALSYDILPVVNGQQVAKDASPTAPAWTNLTGTGKLDIKSRITGLIRVGQIVAPGTYTDTVTLTANL